MKILKSHLLEKVDAKLIVKQLEAELTRLDQKLNRSKNLEIQKLILLLI